jgi:hypothetical protein
MLSTALQQRADLPRLLRRLNGRHPAAVLPPLLIGHAQASQNLYPTALQNYLVCGARARVGTTQNAHSKGNPNNGCVGVAWGTCVSSANARPRHSSPQVALRNAQHLHARRLRNAAGEAFPASSAAFPEALLPLCAGTVVLRAAMNRRTQDR